MLYICFSHPRRPAGCPATHSGFPSPDPAPCASAKCMSPYAGAGICSFRRRPVPVPRQRRRGCALLAAMCSTTCSTAALESSHRCCPLRHAANQLSSAIPPCILESATIQELYLGNNQLTGPLPAPLPGSRLLIVSAHSNVGHSSSCCVVRAERASTCPEGSPCFLGPGALPCTPACPTAAKCAGRRRAVLWSPTSPAAGWLWTARPSALRSLPALIPCPLPSC